MDRNAEEREKVKEAQQKEQARGIADGFLDRQADELDMQAPRGSQRFKLSL